MTSLSRERRGGGEGKEKKNLDVCAYLPSTLLQKFLKEKGGGEGQEKKGGGACRSELADRWNEMSVSWGKRKRGGFRKKGGGEAAGRDSGSAMLQWLPTEKEKREINQKKGGSGSD